MKGKGQEQRGQFLTPPEAAEQARQERLAKSLAARMSNAVKDIKKLQKRYPEKSLLHLLARIRLECGNVAALVAICRIKRNQAESISPEDHAFLEGQKQMALQGLSAAEALALRKISKP